MHGNGAYANGIGKIQDMFNEEQFIKTHKGTIDRSSFKRITAEYADTIKELRDLPWYAKAGALSAAALVLGGAYFTANPDAKAQVSEDIQQAYTDIITTASAGSGLSARDIAAITRSPGLYANPAAPISKKMIPLLAGLVALTYCSGCTDKPMEDVIGDKTDEISLGMQKADDAGMSELDKFVEDNTAGEPKDPNDASQVIIDGWVPPSSIDPADYITPDGDCTVLKKSTIYHGWEYISDIFPESKANDGFMGNNKGFLGKEPEVYIGIMSDGIKKRELFVFNQAFLDKYGNEIAYYQTPQPVKMNDAKDLEWSQVKPTVSPQGIKQYDEVYPGIYYQRRTVSSRKDMMRGSPEKELGIQIRKTA